MDKTFDVPGVRIIRIPVKAAHGLPYFFFRQDSNAVSAFLSMEDRMVTSLQKFPGRKIPVLALELLQAYHVRGSLFEPLQKYMQPAIDPVDIIGSDLHPYLNQKSRTKFQDGNFHNALWIARVPKQKTYALS
ncbi:hypothetical protein [Pedobacter chinensis]